MKGFESIAGYDKEKEELLQLRKCLHNFEKYREMGVRIPRGLILYGEPGVGKTVMARAIADDGIQLIEVRAADCCDETAVEKLQSAFEEAKCHTPAVLLLDELDKIAGGSRHYFMEGNDIIRKILLQEMDKLAESDGVLVVATCNDIGCLGDALVRSGRFDRQLAIDLPDEKERKKIFTQYFARQKLDNELDFGYLSRITLGYTGAEIECIVNEAGLLVMDKRRRTVRQEDVRKVMNRLAFHGQESENKSCSPMVAVHEAGHALVALALAPECIYGASILAQGDTNGHIQFICNSAEPASVESEENAIAVLLAGRVAERRMFDQIFLGSSSDLRCAWEKVIKLLTRHGAYGYEYLAGGRIGSGTEAELSIEKKAADILQRLDSRAEDILLRMRGKLIKIADALLKKQVLSRDELLAFVGKKRKKKAA